MAYKPQYSPGSTIVHTRPKIERIPGPASGCQRHSCEKCPKLTGCRETFEKAQPPREGA